MGNSSSGSSSEPKKIDPLTKNGYIPDTPENNASHRRYKTPIKRNEACLTRIAYINRILSFCCDEVIVAIKMSHVCEAYRETLVRFGTEIWQQVVSEIYKEPGFQTNFLFTLQHPDLCWVVRAVYERGELDKNFMFLGCKPALWQAVRSKNLGAIHVLVEEAGEYSSSDDDDDDYDDDHVNEQQQITSASASSSTRKPKQPKKFRIRLPNYIDLNMAAQNVSQNSNESPLAMCVLGVNNKSQQETRELREIALYLIERGADMEPSKPKHDNIPSNLSPYHQQKINYSNKHSNKKKRREREKLSILFQYCSSPTSTTSSTLYLLLSCLGKVPTHPLVNLPHPTTKCTPLLEASSNFNSFSIMTLLDFGADANYTPNDTDVNVFHVMGKNIPSYRQFSSAVVRDVIDKLCEKHADIEHVPGMKKQINNNIDAESTSCSSSSSFKHFAHNNHNQNIIDTISATGLTPLLFHLFKSGGCNVIVENLIKYGKCGINVRGSCKERSLVEMTPLIFACKINDLVFINLLLDHDADVNFCSSSSSLRGEDGDIVLMSPLVAAINYCPPNIVQKFINRSANLNQVVVTTSIKNPEEKDEKKISIRTSPLLAAVLSGDADKVSLLLNAGADVKKTQDETGICSSAFLDVAHAKGGAKVVALLLKAGVTKHHE